MPGQNQNWSDIFRLWSYAFRSDPLSQKTDPVNLPGAGISNRTAVGMLDLRNQQDGGSGGNSLMSIGTSGNDMVDMTSIQDRQARYKEYERLRNIPEIENCMTVFADESCVAGCTKVATPFGFPTIQWLAEHKADERFLVYCYDPRVEDYTLGWAYNPRKIGTQHTIKIVLDDGSDIICTPDHRILNRRGEWSAAEDLKFGSELMPFYKLPPDTRFVKSKTGLFPRIFTFQDGWTHERFFVDKWSTGKYADRQEEIQKIIRLLASGLSVRQTSSAIGREWKCIETHIKKHGFATKEIKSLGKKADRRRVIGVMPHGEVDVYDISVEDHMCFATQSAILHNCQKDDDGHICKVIVKDHDVKEEAEWLLHSIINIDETCWNWFKNDIIAGDGFYELKVDTENPSDGVAGMVRLPQETMFRIETVKGRVVEFQQAKDGPDYQAIANVNVTQATESDLMQSKAIRFAPDQIVHVRHGEDRSEFYPYGVSLIEPARGPAHQLRLFEDSMLVYRLCITTYVKIRIDQGWKYMGDIRPGDRVWTYDLGFPVLSNVTDWVCNGVKPVYKVSTAHTSITGTDTHPILVRDKLTGTVGYVDINQIKINQHQFINVTSDVEVPKRIERIYTEPFAKLKEWQKDVIRIIPGRNDLIRKTLIKLGLPNDKKNLMNFWCFLSFKSPISIRLEWAEALCDAFGLDKGELVIHNRGEKMAERITVPEFVDEDFARLFGFLLGDGLCFGGSASSIAFSTGQDEDINQTYRALLERYFGWATYRQDKRQKDGIGMWRVHSACACQIFKRMGYTGKSTKRIPPWVFTEKKSVRRAFVEGMVDAGGVKRGMRDKTWNSVITLHNRELVDDIKEIWSGIGLSSGVIKKCWSEEKIIRGNTIPAAWSWSLRISAKPLPFYDDVISIAYMGEEEVFDLTVDHPEHNFIANGVPVHNTRAPERRVFYIDVGTIAGARAEGFMERMKDQFKKRKTTGRGHGIGGSSVEERWHAPAVDEDYWIPIRPNSNTRVETLPGAQGLSEIDDTLYFRKKLYVALNFPANYLTSEDTNQTRITLSAQDCRFARSIERLQSQFEKALKDIVSRHLYLRGYPEESYEDLKIKMTPPSDWRELSRAEVKSNRMNEATTMKSSQILPDFDIYVKVLQYTEDEARDIQARMKVQKMDDLKIQIIANNPAILGVGLPGDGAPEIGTEAGGPAPELMPPDAGGSPGSPPPDQGAPPGGAPMPPQGMLKYMDADPGHPQPQGQPPEPGQDQKQPSQDHPSAPPPLADPTEEEIRKYHMEIEDYASDLDQEEIDFSEI